jgi:hypothetical protein
MKKLTILLFVIFLVSCNKRGEVHTQPQDFIEIHGKVYKLVKIVPEDGARSIWIMYPKDSTDEMPSVINYDVKEGKHTRNETVIKIE